MIYVLVKYMYDYYEFCEILAVSLERSKLEALIDKDDCPLYSKEQRKENSKRFEGYTHYFIHECKDGVML